MKTKKMRMIAAADGSIAADSAEAGAHAQAFYVGGALHHRWNRTIPGGAVCVRLAGLGPKAYGKSAVHTMTARMIAIGSRWLIGAPQAVLSASGQFVERNARRPAPVLPPGRAKPVPGCGA